LKEGFTPTSTEAQLAARMRDLTGNNIPKLEDALSSMSGRRIDAQSATPTQISTQTTQFMQSVGSMTKDLRTYLGTGVTPKEKLAASQYASRLGDRINLESQSIGNTIIQVGQRKDLSDSQKQSMIADLRKQMAMLKATAMQVQQFRFDITKQVSDVSAQQKRK
jgi:hypothetical protein